MRTRVTGGLTLLVALILVIGGARLLAPGASGQASPAPLPAPPAIGQCLDPSTAVVNCSAPHRWEVIASWRADDPQKSAQATAETCDGRVEGYGDLATAAAIDGWAATLSLITMVRHDPNTARAGISGWSICAVQPAWVDSRSTSIQSIANVDQAPEVFGLCLDYMSGLGGVDCHDVHNVQLLGTSPIADTSSPTGVPADPTEDAGKTLSCQALAAVLFDTADPTYGGALTVRVDVQDINGAPVARCLAVPTSGRLLNDSLTALGDRPLPFVR